MTTIFPNAIDPGKVGSYPAGVLAAGGEWYEAVLEWRVWVHPEARGESGNDYYHVFVTYADALVFAAATVGAETPLALVHAGWNDSPREIVTEWPPEWLAGRCASLPPSKRVQAS
jgi:hypothetical protein